jgi:hypothetical protein
MIEAAFRDRMKMLEPEAYPEKPAVSDLAGPPAGIIDPAQVALPLNAAEVASGRGPPTDAEQPQSKPSAEDQAQAERPRRYRDKTHLRFVADHACIVCGRQPCEPHHLRFAQPRALGRKASDEFTVPLCRIHHREVHDQGDERVWWKRFNIDPMPIALELWQYTRGLLRPPEVSQAARDANGSEVAKASSGLFELGDDGRPV